MEAYIQAYSCTHKVVWLWPLKDDYIPSRVLCGSSRISITSPRGIYIVCFVQHTRTL